jgi:hypothetical protein
MAIPVGALPTFGIVLTTEFVARLIKETLPSPEFTTAARFNTGSTAMADGLAPTVMLALGAVGIDAGLGVTARFTAETGGGFAVIPGF